MNPRSHRVFLPRSVLLSGYGIPLQPSSSQPAPRDPVTRPKPILLYHKLLAGKSLVPPIQEVTSFIQKHGLITGKKPGFDIDIGTLFMLYIVKHLPERGIQRRKVGANAVDHCYFSLNRTRNTKTSCRRSLRVCTGHCYDGPDFPNECQTE